MDEITLCYSGKSKVTARKIAAESGGRIRLNRGPTGQVNWGRSEANTELNADTSKATNKYQMRQLFRTNEVPMPTLYSYEEALRRTTAGETLVGRPTTHMKGRGYWVCRSSADVRRAWEGTRRKKAATHFMDFIPNAREFRVHIFNGKSIRISEKDFTKIKLESLRELRGGDYRATFSFVATKPDLDKETLKSVRRAAKKAVRAIGLGFGAVDVLLGQDNQPYVLEVNSAPGLGGSLPSLYSQKIMEWYDGRE